MERGEPKMSARIAKHRDAGMKAARVTVLEMKVFTHLRRQCFELRERINRRRAEMAGKLRQLGYGPDDVPLHDWGIPQDVRLWLMEKQRHADLEAQVQQLSAELTDLPPAHASPPQKLEEGVLDVADHRMTMQSCHPGAATIVSRLSARVAQLADAGVKAAKTVMLERVALTRLEQKCAALSERVSSSRAEMEGRLHKMGYGLDDAPEDDQSMPEEVRTWVKEYKEHAHLKGRIQKLRADFIDQAPADSSLQGKLEGKPLVDLEEVVKNLAAELTNEPLADAVLPEKLEDLPHAKQHTTTLRSRRGAKRNDSPSQD